MPNIDALCASFATLLRLSFLLLIFQCQCISILWRRRQSSGIDLWQRHCILLHLKEIFLEIGTRKKFCSKINVKCCRAEREGGWKGSQTDREVGVSKATPFISVTPCRVANLLLDWQPGRVCWDAGEQLPSCVSSVTTVKVCLCLCVCECATFLWHVRNGAESVTQNCRQIAWNDFISFIYDANVRVAFWATDAALRPQNYYHFKPFLVRWLTANIQIDWTLKKHFKLQVQVNKIFK